MSQIFYTNSLKKMAEELIEAPEPILDLEIKKRNITSIFNKEVYHGMLVNRESINININEYVRSGKSTVMFAIGCKVQESLVNLGFTKNKWSIRNVARTMYELSKKMRDPDLNNVMIGVDEFDDLDETQVNSTIEKSLLDHFSKIQAGRYVHRIYCSPSDSPDPNSNIILNIEQANKEARTTKCYVYYRLLKGSIPRVQLIGHIIVDVAPIIKNWINYNIEELFYKFNKSKKDLKVIEYWRKKDWYIDYMCRKFEKMDLINTMGIFQARELDYADIYLECVESLKPLAKLKGLLSQKQVKNQLKILFRKNVIPTTILGDTLMSERVDGILDFYKQYWELKHREESLNDKRKRGKIDIPDFDTEIELLTQSKIDIMKHVNEQEDELKLLSNMKKRFYDEAVEDLAT